MCVCTSDLTNVCVCVCVCERETSAIHKLILTQPFPTYFNFCTHFRGEGLILVEEARVVNSMVVDLVHDVFQEGGTRRGVNAGRRLLARPLGAGEWERGYHFHSYH